MNPGLPKNVREALARQAVAGPHPAADVLNAYSERALSAQEDSQTAAHLATCAVCREAVFLANSAAEIPQAAEAPAARPAVTWWRWAVPVTALVTITATFIAMNGVKPQSVPATQEARAIDAQKSTADSYVAAKPAATQAPKQSAVNQHASVTRAKKAEIDENVSNGEIAKK